jgi:hypothetical protein
MPTTPPPRRRRTRSVSRYAARLGLPVSILGLVAGLVLGLVAGLVAGPAMSAAAATAPTAPLVVIGVGGVEWSQISPTGTPAMWSLLKDGSTATVTVRSVYAATCPIDGWLTLSAGQRAADIKPANTKNPPPCRPIPEPGPTNPAAESGGRGRPRPEAVTVPNWAQYAATAHASDFAPVLGLLQAQVSRAGRCATAIGPGAAIALADSSGHTASYLPGGSDLKAAMAAVPQSCQLTVVDAGAIRGPGELPIGEPSNGIPTATQLARVDANVGQVLAATPADATVLLVGLADAGSKPHLRVVAMRGKGFGPGVLYASSTRQLGLIQLTDITPTILAQVGATVPDDLGGSPLVRQAGSPTSVSTRLRQLLDYDQANQRVRGAIPRFFTGLVVAQILLYGFAALTLRRRWTGEHGRRWTLHAVRRVALLFSAVPVSTFLANTMPWWRTGHPILMLTLIVAAFTVATYLLASLGPWRRHPLGDVSVIAAVTLVVLAADVMTGSRLQLSSLMGLQPVVAGRFYGIGNVTYALFATAGILLATALADPLVRAGRRRPATLIVVAVATFTVVVDAWPAWGSDFGGPPASIPAFALLAFAVLGVRLTVRKVALIAVGTVAVVSLVAFLDWLRPPDQQSHLGKFVQTVIDGGAWDVIHRKLTQNYDILTSSILSVLVPVAVLFVVLILLRPSSWGASALQRAFDISPVLRAGLLSGLVMWVIGFALNDSGTAIPALSATLAVPLVIATSITALESDVAEPEPPPQPAPATPRTA